MIVCDLCGEVKECVVRQIEDREYDICEACWSPMEARLKGKGRPVKEREIVLLPRVESGPPTPGEPPTIVGRVH